ncbi:restriction endonuclease subunit S [Vibrio parahaemolyticus]
MTGRYKAYPEYKDSGIDWLGEIPESWIALPIKRVSSFTTGMTPSTAVSEYYADDETDYEWIRPEDIKETSESVSASKFLTNLGWKTQRVVPAQSSLICCIGTIGKTGYSLKPVTTNQQITAATFNLSPKYYFYVLLAARAELEQMATGNVVQILNTERFGRLYVPFITENEALQIANFLDHETAKIDTLIAKQEKLIELLKEKRQAVISHAVTQGLNPNAPMKDSGVEWLGEVPEHWDRSRLGFECSVKARLGWKGLKADEYVPEGYIFLATPNIKGSEIDFENVNYITKQRYDESPEIMLQEKDLLVTKDGSTTGTTNLVRKLPAPATVNSSIAVIRSRGNILPEYLYYFFVSTYTQNVIKRMQGGMGVPHLFQADLRWFHILLPSSIEQESIAKYLDTQTAKCDLLIEKATNAIQLMKERKIALISAAVTGKIDVREWSQV